MSREDKGGGKEFMKFKGAEENKRSLWAIKGTAVSTVKPRGLVKPVGLGGIKPGCSNSLNYSAQKKKKLPIPQKIEGALKLKSVKG